MVEWLSDNRASFAAVIVVLLLVTFIGSIYIGRQQAKLRAKDEVFGDPERTRGIRAGVCGIAFPGAMA